NQGFSSRNTLRQLEQPFWTEEADREQQKIYRPDAKNPPGIEVPEIVARFLSGMQQDRGDEVTGQYEEEIDAGPSPRRGCRHPRKQQTPLSMVEKHRNRCDPAQSIQFRNICRNAVRLARSSCCVLRIFRSAGRSGLGHFELESHGLASG